ncbi:hypothetical protein TX25_25470 [Pseudomonas lactis]|jgi:hypothetical protein|nr:hypothetical protein TX25_25470 [Pseudomonas lactis]
MIRLIINTPPAGVAYTFTGIFLQGASRLQGNNSLLSTKDFSMRGALSLFSQPLICGRKLSQLSDHGGRVVVWVAEMPTTGRMYTKVALAPLM